MLINDRPVKILILGEAKITHTQRWTRYFQDSGWTVRALSFDPIPEGVECESLGATVLPRAIHIMLSASRVRSIIESFRPDITSALFLPDYGWLATLANAKPLIVSAWGSDVLIAPKKSGWTRKRIERVIRHADHLIGDAEILRDGLIALGADNSRISTIPLGVDDDTLAIGISRRIESQQIVTVFHNRRLEPIYKPETFIQAAKDAVRSEPAKLRFVMAGNGSLRGRIQSLANSQSLGEYLELRDWLPRDELLHQLASSDIYVSCSESDATSVSLLEAMAAGCFPIVSDLPANREWITDGHNGLLFPVGDTQTLAEKIVAIARDPQKRESARLANSDIIREKALWRHNMSQVEDIIAQVLEKPR
jgi:glycosyltransferase involved in cell wall biosynthesis